MFNIARIFAGTPYSQQSYKVSDSFPFKWINKKWKEGFFVTSMATAASRWAVVMSRNTPFRDQVMLLYLFIFFFFFFGFSLFFLLIRRQFKAKFGLLLILLFKVKDKLLNRFFRFVYHWGRGLGFGGQ